MTPIWPKRTVFWLAVVSVTIPLYSAGSIWSDGLRCLINVCTGAPHISLTRQLLWTGIGTAAYLLVIVVALLFLWIAYKRNYAFLISVIILFTIMILSFLPDFYSHDAYLAQINQQTSLLLHKMADPILFRAPTDGIMTL